MWWAKAGLVATVLGLWGAVALAPAAPSPEISIEVLTPEGWQPLDYSVVGTVTPTVRISGELPEGFRVFNDRPDGRAGIEGGPNGLGREITHFFGPVEEGIWQAVVGMLAGVNDIIVVDSGLRILTKARMLNFTPHYEDLNGNGELDTNEDLDLNGVLDPDEDINGNELLDYDEDFNGNGQLDTDEDLNDNGILDPGEDLNGNGELDEEVFLPITAIVDPTDIAYDDQGVAHHRTTIILNFVPEATDVDISRFLRAHLLMPNGLMIDATVEGYPRTIVADIRDERPAYIVERLLNGLAPDDPTFPPPNPPSFPLALAVLNLIAEVGTVTGERLPSRLIAGAVPNVGEGYNAPTSGFDDDGDNPDELDIFWQHFFMDTFAAHRLVDHLVEAPRTHPVVAVIDSGFGNGAAPGLGDIGVGRLARCQNETGAVFANLGNNGMRDTAAGGHGTHVALFVGGDGSQRVLGTGKDVHLSLYRVAPVAGRTLLNIIATHLQNAAIDPRVRVINLSWEYRRLDTNGNGWIENIVDENGVGGNDSDPRGDPDGDGNPDDDRNWRAPIDDLDGDGRPSINWDGNGDANGDGDRAYDPEPHVDDDLPGSEETRARAVILRARAGLLTGLNAAHANEKIVVVASGNERYNDAFFSFAGVFSVPRRDGIAINDDADWFSDENAFPLGNGVGQFEDPPAVPFFMAVGATGVVNLPRGPEGLAGFSNIGPQISVSAPGMRLQGVAPTNPFSFTEVSGTSFAAPQVSGLAGELIYLDMNRGGIGPYTAEQVVQFIEATADDLGTTLPHPQPANAVIRNDRPGDGHDDRFGYGRINVWKAVLSVANGGLAQQPGRVDRDGDGRDDTFRSLRLISEESTWWYGFKIITSVRGATVWLDGRQLVDPGANAPDAVPGGPAGEINAYAGVRSDRVIMIGVSGEDPTSGIVPVGNNGGEYIITFSIEREDLVDAQGNWRTLSLRRPGDGPADPPVFSLRLDLSRMRAGLVPGVTFDDFVFEILSPDFGDAPLDRNYPVTLAQNGARHLNSNLEWLGRPGQPQVESVSPEFDATDPVDPDGVPNVEQFPDLDRYDDGVTFFPATYQPNQRGRVRFTVCVADAASGRYGNDPDRSIYVNGWIDWNTDGDWADPGEHVVPGARVWPQVGPGGRITWAHEGGNITRIVNSGQNWVTIEAQFQVPGNVGQGELWARFRIDYGENAGRNNPQPRFQSSPGLNGVAGAARFGEVEDYLIGADFGDAPDPPYPTKLVNDGARHLNSRLEWLGKPGRPQIQGVSPEFDATDPADPDGVPNIRDGFPDLDRYDDGVTFFPLTYIPGQTGSVRFTVRVHDGNSPRYQRDNDQDGRDDEDPVNRRDDDNDGAIDEDPPSPTLYLNGWIDWNTDGDWNDPGEHVVPAARIWKRWNRTARRWEWTYQGGNVTRIVDQGADWVTLEAQFPVPAQGGGDIWARFRLDYAENCGARVPPWRRGMTALPDPIPAGPVRFGEVEDYFIGADFGDAPDPTYPTLRGSNGARHLDIHCEWLNYGVSREPDACLAPPPPATADQDNAAFGQPPNLGFRPPCRDKDLDLMDNFQAFHLPNGVRLLFTVHSTISARGYDIIGVDNDGDGRIDEDPVDQRDNDGDGQRDEDPPDPILLTTMSPVAPMPMAVQVLSTPPWSGGKGRYQSVDADDDRDGHLNEEVIDGIDNDGDGLVDEDPPIRKPLIINVFIDWNADGDWDDPGEWVVQNGVIAPETFGPNRQYTLGEPFIDLNGDGVWQPGEPFTDVAGVNDQHYNWFFPAPRPIPPGKEIWVRIRLSYAELADGTVPVGALPPGVAPGPIRSQVLELLGIASASELPPPRANQSRGGMYFGEVEDRPSIRISKTPSNYELGPGFEFYYTIYFSNPGTTELSGLELFDPIPEELEFLAMEEAPPGIYYDFTYDTVAGTLDVPPRSEVNISYRVRVGTKADYGETFQNCPTITWEGWSFEFCSEPVTLAPRIRQFHHEATLRAREDAMIAPHRDVPEFWEYISQGRKVQPISTIRICLPFVGCFMQVSGGIEGVTFELAKPGTEFPGGWQATEPPPGLRLNEQIGALTGIPLSLGTWYPVILAVDTETGETIAELKLAITVEYVPPPPPEEMLPPEENMPPVARAGCRGPDMIGFSEACEVPTGVVVYFSAEGSYDPDGEIVRYEWDFGDGTRASGEVVHHVYMAPDDYEVCLTVWDDEGAHDTACILVSVYPMG